MRSPIHGAGNCGRPLRVLVLPVRVSVAACHAAFCVCMPCLLSHCAAQGLLQQSNTAKAVRALLSELSQLSHTQLQLWWYAQDPAQQPDTPVSHAAAVLQLLRQCCSDLRAADMPELLPGQDAAAVLKLFLIAWVLDVLSADSSSAQRHSSRNGRPEQWPSQDAAKEQHQQGQQEQWGGSTLRSPCGSCWTSC